MACQLISNTREMLHTIREAERKKAPRLPSPLLREEEEKDEGMTVSKKDSNMGDVRRNMEDTFKQTISDSVEFGEDALKYYKDPEDLVFEGELTTTKVSFQFRLKDPSGNGIYIKTKDKWEDAVNLTDENYRTIGKILDAFKNWKQNLVEHGDIMERFKKLANQD